MKVGLRASGFCLRRWYLKSVAEQELGASAKERIPPESLQARDKTVSGSQEEEHGGGGYNSTLKGNLNHKILGVGQ